jgi:hypothetical protein
MNTDIRTLVDGLRPMADFRHAVERTIGVLNTRSADIIVNDEADREEAAELEALIDFWTAVLDRLPGESE